MTTYEQITKVENELHILLITDKKGKKITKRMELEEQLEALYDEARYAREFEHNSIYAS